MNEFFEVKITIFEGVAWYHDKLLLTSLAVEYVMLLVPTPRHYSNVFDIKNILIQGVHILKYNDLILWLYL